MPDEWDVQKILSDWLRAHGYDGLCNLDAECGCELSDLCPYMDESILDCKPGYKRPNPSGESPWLMHPEKEPADA
ncbi:unnamed protein product [marine sediment metagenome]|uniref:Uncharacterized protein n=1 Tax=marine sediment metagenome TaxID=412755 RepID=X0X350_9ZZZZ